MDDDDVRRPPIAPTLLELRAIGELCLYAWMSPDDEWTPVDRHDHRLWGFPETDHIKVSSGSQRSV